MVETALYLIPVQLSECDLTSVLPARNIALVGELRHFIVENVRTARRFLKKCDRNIDIDQLTFYELNRHTAPEDIASYLAPLEAGEPMGVLSEAGCPAIADPGADVVAIAQRKGLKVVPLVGPSSILMGLMGSGFNGQSFAFLGYLPIEAAARAKALEKIAPGSILFTFSCSQAVNKEQFRLAVFSAAAQTRRKVRVLHQLTQPADHPINIYHPEGEYLKGLVLYVE